MGLLPILVTGEFARIQQGILEPKVGPGAPPWWEKGVKRGDLESLGFFCGSDGKESAGLMLGLGRAPGEGNGYPLQYSWASLVVLMVQMVKKKKKKENLPAMPENWVRSLGGGDFLPGEGPSQVSVMNPFSLQVGRALLGSAVAQESSAIHCKSCFTSPLG